MTVLSLRAREPWRRDAACNDPKLGDDRQRLAIFFADDPTRARQICASCRVQSECALAGEGMVGVWAGATVKERERLSHVETGWMAVCRRCLTPFPVEQRKGMSHAPFYCAACRILVRAETVARYRVKVRVGVNQLELLPGVASTVRELTAGLVASAAP